MSRTLELIFDNKVRNAADVEKLESTINRLAQAQQINTGNLRLFNSMLSETAQRSGSYSEALRVMAGSNQLFSELAKAVQNSLKEQNKAAADSAKAAQKAAADFEKAKQAEAAAARRAADAIIAQHQRVQNAVGRVGARVGGQVLGNAVGIPGLGFAGSSLIGSLGLSGGAMMGIGGAAAGVFAGVEMVKSIDQLAKWAQEQKNAAQETGITISEMQELSRVSERTGVNLAGAAKSVQDLSKEMVQGGGRAREIQSALSELGLKSSTAFEEPYKALTDIQKGLAAIKDPVERDRVAIELLGEAAGRAAAATADAAKPGHVIDQKTMDQLDQAREKMADVSDAWDLLKSKFASPLNAVLSFTTQAINTAEVGTDILRATLSAVGLTKPPKDSEGRDESDEYTKKYLAKQAADAKDARNKYEQSWRSTYGTPEDRYRNTDLAIANENKTLQDQHLAGKITDQQWSTGQASLEARRAAAEAARKSAEEYRGQVGAFQKDVFAPIDSAETIRQLTELPKRYNMLGSYGPYQNWMRQLGAHAPGALQQIGRDQLNRQMPGLETGDFSRLYSPLTRENAEFQGGLERQERDARERQEQLKRDSMQRFDNITERTRSSTEDNEAALRLRTAQMSGQRNLFVRQNQLGPTGAAQLDLEDQMKLIGESFAAKSAPIFSAAGPLSQERQIAPTEEEQGRIDREMESQKATLQKLENDRLTQTTEALDKFNDSIEEASSKLRDEFGNFAEGLFSAGLKGHAGTYGRNFLLGQADKVVGNAAKSFYQPGMLSIPGQGSADDPTFLGRMLQGTMFAQDPKAQGDVATKDNTTATVSNTTALLALYSALGGDPGSLGISSGSGSIPFIGGASSSGGPLGQVSAMAKSLGINLPGVTSHAMPGSSSAPIGGPIGSLLKLFGIGSAGPSASSQPGWGTGAGIFPPLPFDSDDSGGWSFATAGQVPGYGGASSSDSFSGFPALGLGTDILGSMGASSTAGTFQSQMTDTIGSAFDSALSGESTPTTGGLTAQVSKGISSALSQGGSHIGGGANSANPTDLGMGIQAAGGAYGMYQGISQMTKGGAQNISGGLGSTLLGASAVLAMIPGGQIAAPFVAAAGMVSDLISSFMGDPRANRAKQLTEQEIAQTYTAPTPMNVTTNANGMITTTDYRGHVESLDALPTAAKSNTLLGFDPYNPSHVLSSSGWSLDPSGMVPPAAHSAPASSAPPVQVNISTMDSKSFMDHGPSFADALIPVLQGTHRISAEIQRVVGPA